MSVLASILARHRIDTRGMAEFNNCRRRLNATAANIRDELNFCPCSRSACPVVFLKKCADRQKFETCDGCPDQAACLEAYDDICAKNKNLVRV